MMDRLARLEELWDGCEGCALSASRTRVVQWRGNPGARLFLIGVAPGADEDEVGLPFVGAVGQVLDRCLLDAGLDPGEDVFMANRVGCRSFGDRAPHPEELLKCSPRLQAMLAIVRPRALLLFGAAARLAGVLCDRRGVRGGVARIRGEEREVEMSCWDGRVRKWPAVITYHPGQLVHTSSVEVREHIVSDVRLAWKLASK